MRNVTHENKKTSNKHKLITVSKINPQIIIEANAQQTLNETYNYSDSLIKIKLKMMLHKRFYTANPLNPKPMLSESRIKRASDDENLEKATTKKNYTYWLNQEDIADIARLEYNSYRGLHNNAEFEVLGAISQLGVCIGTFQVRAKALRTHRLTLIINLANLHWVTLVISYKNNNFLAYYVDSKNNPLPSEYYQLLESLNIQVLSVSPDFPQQIDEYNCGFWALENAYDLGCMLDENQSLYWLIHKLQSPRNKDYFDRRRLFFTSKLLADSSRRERLLPSAPKRQKTPETLDTDEPNLRESEIQLEEEKKIKIHQLLETFVMAFLGAFTKRIGIYHLIAKGERLTEEALKVELKTGIAGALLGVCISQSMVGSIPSLVASLRLLSSKYFLSKDKAQKITKALSEVSAGSLSPILSKAATNIFINFESQFVQITDKAGDKMAMEKMAEDGVGRMFNYIAAHADEGHLVSKEFVEKAVLLGPSEKFFDPNVKYARLRISGDIILDKSGNNINTSNLYEKVGLKVISNSHSKFYTLKERANSNAYGYRRLFDWEKKENGELKTSFKERYEEEHFPQKETVFQFSSRNYDYYLETQIIQSKAQTILNKIENQYPLLEKDTAGIKQTFTSVLFDLRKPVINFTGRIEILKELHRRLVAGRITTIIPALSNLSLQLSSDITLPSSGLKVSVSGLGGIGKTQLALRYAELFSSDYDHNVLWINAETKENIAYSFYKLATKLGLATKDRYGQEKNTEEITEEIYMYFADRKSLFIFDNAENYKAIKTYLPKSILGNNPTLLITSRYANWLNIADTLSLDVFSEKESIEFIKKIINISNDTQNEAIKELNTLLQGLPLALQQALAYITLQKNTQPEFNVQDYIVLYKKKSKELLNFDFSNYTNDPYAKTVLTTWQVTLDKILKDSNGKNALEILNIMAYLNPDLISGNMFLYLKYINTENYNVAIPLHLLKSYSMINPTGQENIFTIHRLVQQVVRIQLEKDPIQFQRIVKETHQLLLHKKLINKSEMEFHYLHFLLYMSEHPELKSILQFRKESDALIILFDKLLYMDIKYWHYFMDLAHIKSAKERNIEFLGEALAYFVKKASLLFLSETLNYIEKK